MQLSPVKMDIIKSLNYNNDNIKPSISTWSCCSSTKLLNEENQKSWNSATDDISFMYCSLTAGCPAHRCMLGQLLDFTCRPLNVSGLPSGVCVCVCLCRKNEYDIYYCQTFCVKTELIWVTMETNASRTALTLITQTCSKQDPTEGAGGVHHLRWHLVETQV